MSLYYDKSWRLLEDVLDRAKLFEDPSYQSIAKDTFDYETLVSTVRLWLDHSFWEWLPLIFETMIFSKHNWLNDYQKRYSTLEEAKAWHVDACNFVKSILKIELE